MITLEEVFEIGEYKITGGSKYLWKCFGPNARFIDFDENFGKCSFEAIFDTETLEIYQASVCDYENQRNYRITNTSFLDDYLAECKSRGADPYEAYDDRKFIDLDEDEDFIEKASAIVRGKEYDPRVTINFEIDNESLFTLMLEAHKNDMTFNNYIEKHVILDFIEKSKNMVDTQQEL